MINFGRTADFQCKVFQYFLSDTEKFQLFVSTQIFLRKDDKFEAM